MPVQYVVVRTEVRRVTPADLTAAWANGGSVRDERTLPEPRRQVAFAENLEAALHLARALASVGPVRSGRQRVKVVRVD
jgi:hypothetical protein